MCAGARSGATWLLADFQAPARGLARYRALAIHAWMYAFFRTATRLAARRLVEPDEFLRAQSTLVLQERRINEWGLLRSDFWKLPGGSNRLNRLLKPFLHPFD